MHKVVTMLHNFDDFYEFMIKVGFILDANEDTSAIHEECQNNHMLIELS